MAKQYHCELCGAELTVVRKAAHELGHIFNIVLQHDCPGHPIEETEDGTETVLDILNNLKPIGPAVIATEDTSAKAHNPHRDLRNVSNNDNGTAAPQGVLDALKNF